MRRDLYERMPIARKRKVGEMMGRKEIAKRIQKLCGLIKEAGPKETMRLSGKIYCLVLASSYDDYWSEKVGNGVQQEEFLLDQRLDFENKINNATRDDVREFLKDEDITHKNITTFQSVLLVNCISVEMQKSRLYNNKYDMNQFKDHKILTCRSDHWKKRQAISFNDDGFVGIAGWADDENVKPILLGICRWIERLTVHRCECGKIIGRGKVHPKSKLILHCRDCNKEVYIYA